MPKDNRNEFDALVTRASWVLASAVLFLFAAFVVFRVLIPAVWEVGDIGKAVSVLSLATLFVSFAYGLVALRRVLFPAPKEKEEKSETEVDR